MPRLGIKKLLAVLIVLAGSSLSARALGETHEITTIISHGPPSNRVDVTFIGDGYTAAEIETTYHQHAVNVIEDMTTAGEALYDTEPYVTYANFFNFHRINLISSESGIDFPSEGIFVDTALDGTDSCEDWTIGLCQLDWAKTDAAIDPSLAAAGIGREWVWVTFNIDRVVGGGHYLPGGPIAIYSGDGGRGPELAAEHAFHEGGHTFHGLADEYYLPPDATYGGPEPWQVNVTANNDPATIKWSRWLGYDDPNDDLSPIGIYEGGMYNRWGVFRPTLNSRMWSSASYCSIAREKIILDIYSLVRPLDGWTDNTQPLLNPEVLSVTLVDSGVIKVDWYVDGMLVVDNGGETFLPADYLPVAGDFVVTARAYDDTDWVRVEDRSSLEQDVSWEVQMAPTDVPAVSEWGIAAMALLMLIAGTLTLRQRQAVRS